MKIKSLLAKPFAGYVYRSIRKGMATALADQDTIFNNLLKTGKETEFGKDHDLKAVTTYQQFRQAVPVRDYEFRKGRQNRTFVSVSDTEASA